MSIFDRYPPAGVLETVATLVRGQHLGTVVVGPQHGCGPLVGPLALQLEQLVLCTYDGNLLLLSCQFGLAG